MSTYNRNNFTHSRKLADSRSTICTDGGRVSVTFKADEKNITRSEHLRDILDSRDKTDYLRQEIEKREQIIERLENEKRLLIEKREEYTEGSVNLAKRSERFGSYRS